MGKTENNTGMPVAAGMKIGNVRYYERNGKVYSRLATTNHMTNERTGAQMVNRLRFSSVILLWKSFKDQLQGSFESVRPGSSAYPIFMKLNHNNGVFLTKDQQQKHFQIITPLHISDGSLRPIQQAMNENKQLVTDIALGSLQITDETTIRDFSIQISRENAHLGYNDELHFVAATQLYNLHYDTPRCYVDVVNLPLDMTDTRPLLAVIGKHTFCNKDGFLATKADLPTGCYAFYLSREGKQQTLVSPQSLISNNDELIDQYLSEEQFTIARKSFGKSEDAMFAGWKFEKPTFD